MVKFYKNPYPEYFLKETELSEKEKEYVDTIAQSYEGKTIFITGGTGFIGKVLIEKLLRRCSDVKRIYLLLRGKKEENPENRLKQQFENPLYDLLKKTMPEEIFTKIILIEGDVSKLNLGISEEDRRILNEEVEIVFHVAATVRFDENLKSAILINTRGTRELCNLALKFQKLKVFVHVSTAYIVSFNKVLKEIFYPATSDPHYVIKIAECRSGDEMKEMTPRILGKYPNTYSFSKSMAEGIVQEYVKKLPIIVVRPSIVVPIFSDPFPGWTDNVNGPTGLLVVGGKGLIRTSLAKLSRKIDFVWVDLVANTLIVAACKFQENPKMNRVINCTTSSEIHLTWGSLFDCGLKCVQEIPFNNCLWYPTLSTVGSKFLYLIYFYIFQFIPAVILDCFLILLGYDRFLVKIQRRIKEATVLLSHYTTNAWEFHNEEFVKLRSDLNPKEFALYKMDPKSFDLYQYMKRCIHCVRIFILNELDDQLPRAKVTFKMMFYLDRLMKTFLITIGFYFIHNYLFN